MYITQCPEGFWEEFQYSDKLLVTCTKKLVSENPFYGLFQYSIKLLVTCTFRVQLLIQWVCFSTLLSYWSLVLMNVMFMFIAAAFQYSIKLLVTCTFITLPIFLKMGFSTLLSYWSLVPFEYTSTGSIESFSICLDYWSLAHIWTIHLC